jgi:hypothetical protein
MLEKLMFREIVLEVVGHVNVSQIGYRVVLV